MFASQFYRIKSAQPKLRTKNAPLLTAATQVITPQGMRNEGCIFTEVKYAPLGQFMY